MPEHIFYQSGDGHSCNDMGECSTCVLSVCKVCGGMEGSLTTDCPDDKIKYNLDQDVYSGKIDYRDSEGWVKKLNPTNISWLYGRYIRFHGTDVEFAENEKLSMEYFTQIMFNWLNDNYSLNKLKSRYDNA